MKLLIFTRKVDRNDAVAGFSYWWVKAFAAEVETLDVLCLEQGDISGLPQNCRIHSLGKEKGNNRLQRLWLTLYYGRKLVALADAVFTHQNPEYGLVLAPWCKLYRKPLISWYVHKSVTWKLRWLNFLANKMVTASKESFRLASKKLVLLSHGIDTDLFSFLPQSRSEVLAIVSISRITKSKQLDKIVQVVSRLQQLGEKVTLDIYGQTVMPADEEYLQTLKTQIERDNLQQIIQFKGPIANNQTPQIYQQSDLLINCSVTGSLDKGILEAMSCGTLVLTSNEAFKFFFKEVGLNLYADNEAALVDKIRQLIKLPDRRALQTQLRKIVEREHNLESLVKKIIALYQL